MQDVPEYHVYRKALKEDLQNKHTHITHILIKSEKRIALARCKGNFLWVSSGTRTHDIQNHNLTL